MERERFSSMCTSDMYSCDEVLMCQRGETYEFVPATEPDADGYYDIVKCADGNLGWCSAIDIGGHFLDAPV